MIKKPLIIVMLAMLQLAAHAQQTYQLDIKKSKILWNNGNIMGGHYGYLLFNSGSLNYTAAGEPFDGTFNMDMNSVHSLDHTEAGENQKTDKAIRKPNFFDVAKYPEAVMNVKQITHIANTTNYTVTGDLTIKGVTNPVTFTATIKKAGNAITAVADTKLHRLKYHIDMQPQPKQWELMAAIQNKVIDDEIAITLKLVFNKM